LGPIRPIPSPEGGGPPPIGVVAVGKGLVEVAEVKNGFRVPAAPVGDEATSGIVALRRGAERLYGDWFWGVDPMELVRSEGAGLGPAAY
jgi:hypothetical protein